VDPAGFHLAQLNIARPKAPMDSGFMDSFNALLDPVNAVADHLAVMRRRREWFNRMAELEQAFTFKERFPAPDAKPSRTT